MLVLVKHVSCGQLELAASLLCLQLLLLFFLASLLIDELQTIVIVSSQRLRAVHLLRLDASLVNFDSDRHFVLFLNLAGSNLSLELVKVGIWDLDALAGRDDLIVEIVVVIICHSVLKQKI